MKVPFLDLAGQHEPLRAEILAEWVSILETAHFVSGARVAEFERAFAAAHGVSNCVAVSNGTVGLEIPLRALGVGPGDQVAVPANTFIATAEAVSNVGAAPVFVDVDRATMTIGVDALAATLESNPAIVGTIPVHLYGHPVDLDAVAQVASATGTWLLEDAAQAHLATYKGKPVGGAGIAASFSFYPGKNLGAPGEGGAILTNDDGLAADMRAIRDHGQSEKYHSRLVGTNARMIELVAAVLSIKLEHLAGWTDARRAAAAQYSKRLAGTPAITLPSPQEWADPVWHLYVVHTPHRDELQERLAALDIATGLHYPVPLHLQEAYRSLGHLPGDFPVAEQNAATCLSLPMHEGMTTEMVNWVSRAVVDVMQELAS